MPLYFVEKKNLLEEVFKNMSLPYSEKTLEAWGLSTGTSGYTRRQDSCL